jgi:hypothetical protein
MEEINSSVVGSNSTGLMNIQELVIRLSYDNELLKLYSVDLAKYKHNEFFKYFSNFTIITPTNCTLLSLKAPEITICTFLSYVLPLHVSTRVTCNNNFLILLT